MQCVLGVDGGNSKTIAIVAALDGTILGYGRGGCGDIYNAEPTETAHDSVAAALANVDFAVQTALHAARRQPADIVVSVFNMAGADWPEDFDTLHTAMRERGYGRTILVQNDALGALYTEVPDAVGVSVVCGTGTATGARGPTGKIWHTSFWQDEAQGSIHLAEKALFAIYRSELGIEPPTSLTPRVLDVFQVATVEEVLHLFTSRLRRAPDIAPITPILLDEAEAGDEVARRVVVHHGWILGDLALAAARRVGITDIPFALVLAGGIFRHPSPLLAGTIIERVQSHAPLAEPVRARTEPIVGVLLLALAEAGITGDGARECILATMPPHSLFATVALV